MKASSKIQEIVEGDDNSDSEEIRHKRDPEPRRTCVTKKYEETPLKKCAEVVIPRFAKVTFFDARIDGENAKKNRERYSIPRKNRHKLEMYKHDDEGIDLLENGYNPRKNFVFEIQKFIFRQFNHGCDENTIHAIGFIYDVLGSNMHELILFMANAMFNTCGFKFLTNFNDTCNGCFKSRGLLMITGECNYKKLCDISRTMKWLKRPELLGYLTQDAVYATLMFWKQLLYNCELNFYAVLQRLNPQEARRDAQGSKELVMRYQNRKLIYDLLCNHFYGQVVTDIL
ncbi:hypothetical protein COBT_002294 [Conglomerata obtusa]